MASWLVRSSLRIEWSGFEPWQVTLRCVLGQDTFLSFVLYTLVYKKASANGYGNLTKCSGLG